MAMKKMMRGVGVFLLMWGFIGPAQAVEDEKDLLMEQRQTDQEVSGKQQETRRIGQLAQQYQVDPAVVQDMRNKGQGWGEVSIQLAMATELSKTQSAAYPTTADGLKKVETLRAEGRGYGEIAQQLGFKLGPVVSGVHRSRMELKKPELPPTGQEKRSGKSERERGTGTTRPERPERPGRPEGMEHHGRPKG